MTGLPMHFDLREDAVPCRHYRARTISFQRRAAVEAQLASMVTKGVIEKVPVGESFKWCHPMVVVPKKSSTEPRTQWISPASTNRCNVLPTPTECQGRSSENRGELRRQTQAFAHDGSARFSYQEATAGRRHSSVLRVVR